MSELNTHLPEAEPDPFETQALLELVDAELVQANEQGAYSFWALPGDWYIALSVENGQPQWYSTPINPGRSPNQLAIMMPIEESVLQGALRQRDSYDWREEMRPLS